MWHLTQTWWHTYSRKSDSYFYILMFLLFLPSTCLHEYWIQSTVVFVVTTHKENELNLYVVIFWGLLFISLIVLSTESPHFLFKNVDINHYSWYSFITYQQDYNNNEIHSINYGSGISGNIEILCTHLKTIKLYRFNQKVNMTNTS